MAQATVAAPAHGIRLPIFPPGLPILVGFRNELLPVLVLLWPGLLVAWAVTGRPYFVPIGLWATVTILTLWPVGRRLERTYLSYRTVLFVLGVLSMAYIPAIGFILQSNLSYTAKIIFWILLPLDLTVLAILPSLRPAIGRPIQMFFRPDMLFGDGRVLCCGTLALLFGIRYLIGPPPPQDIPIALPRWNWWGLAFAMGFGFIPSIPLRGMTKLLMRMARLIRDEWYGWRGVILKETFLVLTILSIAFGFHHVFKGWTPLEPRFWEEASKAIAHRGPWPGLVFLGFGYLWLVFVRGGYKKRIGEPFITETVTQTWIKELLYVPGVVTLVPGLMLLIEEHFGALNKPAMLALGIPFFIWGLICVTAFRVLAQVNQRRAIVQQMAGVVLPAQLPEVRRKVLLKVMNALCEMPEPQRLFYMRAMQEAISQASESVREVMTTDRLVCLTELPSERRRVIIMSMDKILLGTA